jgi:hypothetical protein
VEKFWVKTNRLMMVTGLTIIMIAQVSAMIRGILPEGIIGHTATLTTIIGKAASTGRMKTMMDMMTGMMDFGTKGNFDSVFSYSVFQLFLGTVKKHCQKKIMKDLRQVNFFVNFAK